MMARNDLEQRSEKNVETYLNNLEEKLKLLKKEQEDVLETVAGKMSDLIEQGGVIHLFGAGHSHILAEEVFYRAGGLVPIS
ncbi:putative phosphosugar-binding protein [Texcoconibacillus texcoconensis]|uniref:Putative phosphosugar-binding protein n=1 Tax=Texcoconibacillus texcoconensis TaxID=1095777 RepID=A0A840QRN9_9BACI|nr:putative phosphosugar-binding protein [Texcoconibacillus texcoconensis]